MALLEQVTQGQWVDVCQALADQNAHLADKALSLLMNLGLYKHQTWPSKGSPFIQWQTLLRNCQVIGRHKVGMLFAPTA